jgi:hypothetical protein
VSFPKGTGPSNGGYDVAIVDISGRVLARAHAAVRSFIEPSGISAPAAVDLPEISVSNTRLYYLDGDAQVRALSPDGSSVPLIRVAGDASAHAAFAVSPDDRRIAISIISYSPATKMPVGVRLYVEDLSGTNQSEIYSSTSNYVWPVGWHNGDLVLSSGSPLSPQGIVANPYSSHSYHLVDPSTASRIATIGFDVQNPCGVWGPLTPAGTACYTRTASSGMGGYFRLLGWDGRNYLPSNGQYPTASGGWAAVGIGNRSTNIAMCCDDSTNVTVRMPLGGGSLKTSMNGQGADWVCWLDADHLLSGSVYQQQFQPQMLTIDTNVVVSVDAKGFCAGVMPGDLSS